MAILDHIPPLRRFLGRIQDCTKKCGVTSPFNKRAQDTDDSLPPYASQIFAWRRDNTPPSLTDLRALTKDNPEFWDHVTHILLPREGHTGAEIRTNAPALPADIKFQASAAHIEMFLKALGKTFIPVTEDIECEKGTADEYAPYQTRYLVNMDKVFVVTTDPNNKIYASDPSQKTLLQARVKLNNFTFYPAMTDALQEAISKTHTPFLDEHISSWYRRNDILTYVIHPKKKTSPSMDHDLRREFYANPSKEEAFISLFIDNGPYSVVEEKIALTQDNLNALKTIGVECLPLEQIKAVSPYLDPQGFRHHLKALTQNAKKPLPPEETPEAN